MKVAYTADALGDVAQILSFVAERSPSHAPGIAARIDTAVKSLRVFPRAARFDRKSGIYERPIPELPLIIIYTVSDELWKLLPYSTRRVIPRVNVGRDFGRDTLHHERYLRSCKSAFSAPSSAVRAFSSVYPESYRRAHFAKQRRWDH